MRVPLTIDSRGRVRQEVASARYNLVLPDQPEQTLPLTVALIRDLRRPTQQSGLASDEGSSASAFALVPIVTTAESADASQLA